MATPPVPVNRLKQIANDACESAIGSAEYYDHAKTEQWNSTIINFILKAVIAESTPKDTTPTHKYAVNSTIVQHLIPTSQLNKPKGSSPSPDDEGVPVSTDGKPHAGRRGMHSATGAYWDEKRDGMWSYKFDGGEGKGMDVVISLIWIGI